MSKLIIKKQYSPEPRDIYFTVPNFISLLRIISIPFIAMLVSHHRMVTALVVLALSAISDGLDGMIARSFNQVSKIGQILDPIADRLLIFCSILALGVANIIPWWMLIVVGLRDLIMAVLILVLAQHDYGPLPVHFVGKAGTAMLLIAIVALIFADIWSNSAADTLHLCGLATGIWGVGLYWLAGYIYMRQGIQLLKNDTNSKDSRIYEVRCSTFRVVPRFPGERTHKASCHFFVILRRPVIPSCATGLHARHAATP